MNTKEQIVEMNENNFKRIIIKKLREYGWHVYFKNDWYLVSTVATDKYSEVLNSDFIAFKFISASYTKIGERVERGDIVYLKMSTKKRFLITNEVIQVLSSDGITISFGNFNIR